MKIDITGYSDLGKCAFGTSISMDGDIFDTEKHHLYVWDGGALGSYTEQKIESAADLCKFLWCIPGVATGGSDGTLKAWFGKDLLTWWHSRYDGSVERDEKAYARLLKRIDKEQDPKKLTKLKEKLKYADPSGLKDVLASLDERRAAIADAIIERNACEAI